MTSRRIALSFTLTALCAGPASGSIIDLQWVGPNSGLWHNTSHWNPDTIPNNGGGFEYHATISTRFGNLVNLGTSATISKLTIGPDDTLNIINGRTLGISALDKNGGVINNAGTIELGSTGSTTGIRPADGLVTLTGGGTILMGNHPSNWINRLTTDGALLNVDNVIEGAGQLSWSSTPTPITNQHLIIANQTNPLTIQPSSALFTNQGELRAENGGTLVLNAGTYDNMGGLIEARAGSLVNLSGSASIFGGTLDTQGDGLMRVTSSTPLFDNLTHAGHTIIDNGRTLQVAGTIENTGLIELDSTGSTTSIRPADGLVTLTGGGTILMGDHPNNWINRATTDGALLNVDNVIEGAGRLSFSSTPMPITNQHLIIANQTAALTIQPSTALFTNEGDLRAELGGTLVLNAGTYDNTGGLIAARAGSLVNLSGSALITGGTLDTQDDGLIEVTGSSPEINDLSNSGHIRINNNRTMRASGTIHNTGLIEIDSTGSSTYLRPTDGTLTLTGGGTIRLSDSANNWIYRQTSDGALLNVDNVIEGAGNLSWSSLATPITNQHLIIANQSNSLTLQPSSALFTNEGELRAEAGGTLQMNSGTYDNTGGLIEARAGSAVQLNGSAIITGGTLDTQDDGLIEVTGSTPEINDLSNSGHIRINNNRTMRASGTIHNTGLIELDSTGSSTYFRPADGPVILTGGGTVQLSDSSANWMYRANPGSYWINQDNTVRGAGNLSWSGARTGWINHGSIIADGENLLDIAPDSTIGFINHGLLHAQNTGGVAISGGMMNQQGQALIDAGSTLSRNTGHYIQTAGTTTVNGTLAVTGSNNELRLQGGLLTGNGTVTGTIRNTAGVITPDETTGVLSVMGTFLQSNLGSLRIDISGEVPGAEHDVLAVFGHAQLGGTLDPQIDASYSPAIGTQWTVLEADSRSGTFNAVVPCQNIRVIYESDAVSVEYTGVTRIGDLNCDAVVDVSDLLILLAGWGQCPTNLPCPGDLNGSGAIDVSDLLILLSNWG